MSFVLSDHGSLGGWSEYDNYCKQYEIKKVFGNEVYISEQRERMFFVRDEIKRLKSKSTASFTKEEILKKANEVRKLSYEFEDLRSYNHLVIIVKSQHGLHNLIKLSNEAAFNFYKKPINTYEEIFSLPKDENGDRGIIVTTACLAGSLSRRLMADKYEQAKDWVVMMNEQLGKGNFYLEVQPNEMKIQKEVNKGIIQISKDTKIPIIVGTDSHYINKSFSKLHKLFLLIQGKEKEKNIGKKKWWFKYENKKGEIQRKKVDKGQLLFGKNSDEIEINEKIKDVIILDKKEIDAVWLIEAEDLSFKTEEQTRKVIKKHNELKPIENELIKNNKLIYDLIDDNISLNKLLKLPIFENAKNILKLKCVKGLIKIKRATNKKYLNRLKFELEMIGKGNLESYFLILEDVFNFAKKRYIPIGPSRGSAASSLVLYILGVTRINPFDQRFPQDLFKFERFLNVERILPKKMISIKTEDEELNFELTEKIKVLRNNKKTIVIAKNIQQNDLIL